MRAYHARTAASILGFVLIMTGCQKEIIPEALLPTGSHEEYGRALRSLDLDKTALGHEWLTAADRALDSSVPVELPFQLEGYWDVGRPVVLGYRFSIEAGQRIKVNFDTRNSDEYKVFIDLFRLSGTSPAKAVLIASYPPGQPALPVTALSDAEYLLRVQPELLRGGRYHLSISAGASLAFPVEGRTSRHIGSFFGDPRDGGARLHHGIDIFASRGTPVLAPAAGRISRVGTSLRGGRIIYLRDPELLVSYYFAHLETQDVEQGALVEAEDRIGTVGNSGNAITTPPHLHFGIYVSRQGPLNPYHFVYAVPTDPPPILGDTALIGGWSRIKLGESEVWSDPGRRRDGVGKIRRDTPVQVLAMTGNMSLVNVPNGIEGYIPSGDLENGMVPITEITLTHPEPIREGPSPDATVKANLAGGEKLAVIGSMNEHLFVRTESGYLGWLPDPRG